MAASYFSAVLTSARFYAQRFHAGRVECFHSVISQERTICIHSATFNVFNFSDPSHSVQV